MKFLALIVIVCTTVVCASNEVVPQYSESLKQQLASLDYDLLPEVFKNLNKNLRTGGHSGWCCANEEPVKTIQRTRVGREIIITTQIVKVGYGPCGTGINVAVGSISLGLDKKCTLYDTRTKQEVRYHVEHYDVPDPQSCPDKYVRCCANYIDVAGVCFDIFMVDQHLGLLVNIGLLSTVAPNLG